MKKEVRRKKKEERRKKTQEKRRKKGRKENAKEVLHLRCGRSAGGTRDTRVPPFARGVRVARSHKLMTFSYCREAAPKLTTRPDCPLVNPEIADLMNY